MDFQKQIEEKREMIVKIEAVKQQLIGQINLLTELCNEASAPVKEDIV